MDAAALELQETMLRLAKGIVSARERFQHRHATRPAPPAIAGALVTSPFASVLDAPVSELKAAVEVWESAIRLARAQAVSD